MATMYKGNQLWKANQDPISESNPVSVKDNNSDAIKTRLNALASEEKLELVRALLESIDNKTATDTTLAEANGVLEAINAKDFATQTTLAQVKTELDLIKTELETIKANQLSGEQKVQLSGNIVELGLLADRPTATPENKGMGYFAWDAPEGNKLTYSDGTKWVVNQ